MHVLHDQSSTIGQTERVVEQLQELLRYKKEILRGLEKTGDLLTFDEIGAMVTSGQVELIIRERCIMMMQLYLSADQKQKHYHCLMACGDLEALVAEIPRIEAIARERGFTALTFSGRTPWRHFFKPEDGWRIPVIKAIKELT